MMLFGTVAETLAPALAKAVLRLWLKDSDPARDKSDSLGDLLRSRTSDILAVRRGERQLEEIGERLVIELLPIFEVEGAWIDEGGKIAVASAVAETLKQYHIDATDLAQFSLDPIVLAKHLIKVNPVVTASFSATEMALYERVILEASQYIVDVGLNLPAFTTSTFTEILKRERLLLDISERIIQDIGSIRQVSKQQTAESLAFQFEAQFRRAVLRNLNQLELLGVNDATNSRLIPLTEAFVSLSVRRIPDPTTYSRTDETRSGTNVANLPIELALEKVRKLMLVGPPGSGKTTVLKWIAVQSASKQFNVEMASWNDAVPFFIRLREHERRTLPVPEEFPNLISPFISEIMPASWVQGKLRSGHAIVLVDGIDEVSESSRARVLSWLEDLTTMFPHAFFIISSQSVELVSVWRATRDFEHAELQPMQLSEVDTFIDHWHQAVGMGLQGEMYINELVTLSNSLKRIIRNDRRIRSLATNPLFCAILCTLHRSRRTLLPSGRIELFNACTELLLERRDWEWRTVDINYPLLTFRQKKFLLQELAYWMLRNGWSSVSRYQAQKQIAKRLAAMDLAVDIADKILSYFIERTALLREPVPQEIDFTHVTLQEYFAAHAVVDNGDIGVLVKNADNPLWREVVIITAGLARKPTARKLILEIIRRGDEDPKRRHQLYLLAIACLSGPVELDTDVREEVKKRLADLVPPKTMQEAATLASAGELAVPHLLYDPKYKAAIAVACIRTLSLIGSESAREALTDYASDKRHIVLTELHRAWDLLDAD